MHNCDLHLRTGSVIDRPCRIFPELDSRERILAAVLVNETYGEFALLVEVQRADVAVLECEVPDFDILRSVSRYPEEPAPHDIAGSVEAVDDGVAFLARGEVDDGVGFIYLRDLGEEADSILPGEGK